ncbi:MAG: hypothetical protein IPN09_12610, partial [Bacteroidetes bacterium]|nr:hypothetical protein [Bacteroidota bacterium]
GATGLENIEKAKYDRLGGSNTVDPEHFLNIWICKIQGTAFSQLFGFAYPPADLPNYSMVFVVQPLIV